MSLTFWKPGTVGPGSTLDRVPDSEAIVVSAPPQESRDRLPIYKHRQKLLYCVENYGVSIVLLRYFQNFPSFSIRPDGPTMGMSLPVRNPAE
ncbi:hypothetical protein EST38_g7750 [Candolleomyces aberdarensis]|uniref:Uncharacterized protein n=1 Tax=Candolleomyces aberdarensis TaxID=2316362 RepID=A0A4Q2DEF0_9AGAR|nr:hypothetical protein EST38_g7750 [Candolleomyces aberdarensis]